MRTRLALIIGLLSLIVACSESAPTPTPAPTETPTPRPTATPWQWPAGSEPTATPTATPVPTPTATPTPRPTPTLRPTVTPRPTATPTPTPIPVLCPLPPRTHQGTGPDPYIVERLNEQGLCLGLHYAEQRGEEDLERWAFYYARAHAAMAHTPEAIAIAKTDFDYRCDGDPIGDTYLVGPLDFELYAERYRDEGEEASERYLPCTLHQNGEIIVVRETAHSGWNRWYAP